MASDSQPTTVGELRESGYKVLPVKQEVRRNLIARIREGQELFPGIVGFEDSVIPQLENAVLAGQDIILLGERGQAKSRLIRDMTDLFDEPSPQSRAASSTTIHLPPSAGRAKTAWPRAATTSPYAG